MPRFSTGCKSLQIRPPPLTPECHPHSIYTSTVPSSLIVCDSVWNLICCHCIALHCTLNFINFENFKNVFLYRFNISVVQISLSSFCPVKHLSRTPSHTSCWPERPRLQFVLHPSIFSRSHERECAQNLYNVYNFLIYSVPAILIWKTLVLTSSPRSIRRMFHNPDFRIYHKIHNARCLPFTAQQLYPVTWRNSIIDFYNKTQYWSNLLLIFLAFLMSHSVLQTCSYVITIAFMYNLI